MGVATNVWQLVDTGGSEASMLVQNTGEVRIAWVIANSLPGPTDITLDGHGHGVLQPGGDPVSFTNLSGRNLYVRALGPKNGRLYAYATS